MPRRVTPEALDTSFSEDVTSSSARDSNANPPTESQALKPVEKLPDDTPYYANGIYDSFLPWKIFMKIFGRLPLYLSRGPAGSGSYTYFFDWKRAQSWYCFGSLIFMWILSILFFINSIGIFINFPSVPAWNNGSSDVYSKSVMRIRERYLMRRHACSIVIIFNTLINCTLSSHYFYQKRHYLPSYMTFLSEAVEVIRVDCSEKVKREMIIIVICNCVFLLLFALLYIFKLSPACGGTPGMFTLLLFRFIDPIIVDRAIFPWLRTIMGWVFLYMLVVAKVHIFFFVFFTKILRNAYLIWNHRVDRVMHHGEDAFSREQKVASRTGYDHLFKDHVCLLDLIEGADHLFSNVIEPFFAAHVMSLTIEAYFLYRAQTATKEDFKYLRQMDTVAGVLFFIHTLGTILYVSFAGTSVSEEASEGLEIVRRKGLMGPKTDEELYFVLSLYVSFCGHYDTAISAARFFSFDKSFVVGFLGTIFSYFVIIIQFSPILLMTEENSRLVQEFDREELLDKFESTIDWFHFGSELRDDRETISPADLNGWNGKGNIA
ncbi:Gustatory receptor for bitter taste 66a [Orchesella cincta]|uniref:Gustatory receptor for bitter taste 66a n=1 Tax=Orchesella cincta TaxID=48709 RepID=A0A1D2N8E4_ORCCI|nr:Gustatory receptor for bitter taste 66a [Orchesella cincta]